MWQIENYFVLLLKIIPILFGQNKNVVYLC